MSGGVDFSGILANVDSTTIISGVIAAAGIVALVGFSSWGSRKVGTFFDAGGEGSGYTHCDFCGEAMNADDGWMEYDGDLMCPDCSRDDSRWAFDEDEYADARMRGDD